MSKSLSWIFLLIILFTGCEKEPLPYIEEDLTGKWQLDYVEYQYRIPPEKKRRTGFIQIKDGTVFELRKGGRGFRYSFFYPDTVPLTWDLNQNELLVNSIFIYGIDTSISKYAYTILTLSGEELSLLYLGPQDPDLLSLNYFDPFKSIHHYKKINE